MVELFTGAMFMSWIEKRLLPTFKACMGDEKKMILLLDNARYNP